MKINYGIIAFTVDEVGKFSEFLHFVGFEEEPKDWIGEMVILSGELKSNPEFGLQDINFRMAQAPKEVVEYFADMEPDYIY